MAARARAPRPAPGAGPTRARLKNRRVRRAHRRRARAFRRLAFLWLAAFTCWFWTAGFWRYEGETRVTGNRMVSAEAVAALARAPIGEPLWRIDPGAIESRLRTLPAVRDAVVRRWLFPARLEVQIAERRPLMRVFGTRDHWIDEAGALFRADPRTHALPTPVQIETSLAPGRALPASVMAGVRLLLEAWPEDPKGRLDARNPADLRALWAGWPVRFGSAEDLQAKVALLNRVLPLAKPYRDRLEYIDLRFVESPALRLEPGAAPAPLRVDATP